MREEIKHNCTYCDYRHFSCPQETLPETENCKDFIAGKCFYCAMYDLKDTTICNDTLYPCGCENFKEGNNFDEYLQQIEDTDQKTREKIQSYTHQVDREKARKRRKNDKGHERKLRRKVTENKGYMPGPYIDDVTGRVKIWQRGSGSRWLKQQAHKKVRRKKIDEQNDVLYSRSLYKRVFDYWWSLF